MLKTFKNCTAQRLHSVEMQISLGHQHHRPDDGNITFLSCCTGVPSSCVLVFQLINDGGRPAIGRLFLATQSSNKKAGFIARPIEMLI
jgi:hypothetical protein